MECSVLTLIILIFYFNRDLDEREYTCIVNQELAISDIVLWEMAMLAEAGRLKINLDDAEFRSFLRTLTVLPITLEIARLSTQ